MTCGLSSALSVALYLEILAYELAIVAHAEEDGEVVVPGIVVPEWERVFRLVNSKLKCSGFKSRLRWLISRL